MRLEKEQEEPAPHGAGRGAACGMFAEGVVGFLPRAVRPVSARRKARRRVSTHSS